MEQSVANGSLEGKLVCPPLPENVEELELPMTSAKHQPVVCHISPHPPPLSLSPSFGYISLLLQWEKVLMVVVAVLFGVLLLHLVTDFARGRWRAWQRRRQLMENTTVIYKRLENGHGLMGEGPGCGSGEESESEETTLLIRDPTALEEHRSVSSLEHKI